MSTDNHRHRPNGDPRDVSGYAGPINGAARRNPRADGNIAVTENCRCGAVRVTNINGTEHEYGPWIAPATPQESRP